MPKELINDDSKAFATLVLTAFFHALHYDEGFAKVTGDMIAALDRDFGDNEFVWKVCFGMAVSAFVDKEAEIVNKNNTEQEKL